jgi:amylovoran biosynthesis glycosyltransferase AmsE
MSMTQIEPAENKLTVSVLMSVFNTPVAEANQAISSILKQDHNDFQFVIIDDNSSKPELLRYLKLLKDKRIVQVRTYENKGLAYALNLGLNYCTGDIVIRMDADDIASPYLISHHLDYFSRNPGAVICGVQISGFGEKTFKTHHPPIVTKEMAARNDKFWFVNHPGIAFKKSVVESVGAYGTCPINLPEDYHLWCKLLKAGYVINNMPDMLIRYRVKRKEERNHNEWVKYLEENRKMLIL